MQQKTRKKIPPTPGFELQVTQCQVGATLSSPPGGMDFFLKPKVSFILSNCSIAIIMSYCKYFRAMIVSSISAMPLKGSADYK